MDFNYPCGKVEAEQFARALGIHLNVLSHLQQVLYYTEPVDGRLEVNLLLNSESKHCDCITHILMLSFNLSETIQDFYFRNAGDFSTTSITVAEDSMAEKKKLDTSRQVKLYFTTMITLCLMRTLTFITSIPNLFDVGAE